MAESGLPDPDAHLDPAAEDPGLPVQAQSTLDQPDVEHPVGAHAGEYAPLVRATRMSIEITRARTGTIKSVTAYLPGAEPLWPEYRLPSGAKSMIKALANAHVECVVTYARGYAIDGNGQVKREAIWEANTPDENDQRKRIKVGTKDPQPVDNILVRGVWRDEHRVPTRVLGAYWTEGTHEHAVDWVRDTRLDMLTATQVTAALKALT